MGLIVLYKLYIYRMYNKFYTRDVLSSDMYVCISLYIMRGSIYSLEFVSQPELNSSLSIDSGPLLLDGPSFSLCLLSLGKLCFSTLIHFSGNLDECRRNTKLLG